MPRKLTQLEKERRFKGNKLVINRVVRNFLAKNKVGKVHGTRATNAQLPKRLQRETVDWDVFVKKPKAQAKKLEKALDKKFGGDLFGVKKGKGSPGIKVQKVISNVTGEAFVDFATPNRMIPTVAKRGVRFATLKDQVDIAKENVRDKEKDFRREKDQSLINRVNKFQRRRKFI